MTDRTSDRQGKTSKDVGIAVASRLRLRSMEVEEAILTRIRSVASDPVENEDIRYEEGQIAAVAAILRYALTGIEHGEELTRLTPSEAVAQVHYAARTGVGLDTIMRRYTAGNAELGDFVMQEADRGDLLGYGTALRSVQRRQAWLLDHLIVTVNNEYVLETERTARSPERRLAEYVRRLLAYGHYGSEDPMGLGYEFGAWHLGIIGTGNNAEQAIQDVARRLACRLLCVSYDDQSVWAWLGGERKHVTNDYQRVSSASWPAGISLTVGQPAEGFDGWRLTHRQAQDTLLVSRRRPKSLTLYTDVALLASWLRDEERARALIDMYLSPLDEHRCSGQILRETLREYFAAGRNAAKAGRNLNVSRRTMSNRMATIEKSLGSLDDTNQAELEIALRLDELV